MVFIYLNEILCTNYWYHVLLDGIKIILKKFLIFTKFFNGPKLTPKNQEFEQLASTLKQLYKARTKWYHFFFWQCPGTLLDYWFIMKLIENFISSGRAHPFSKHITLDLLWTGRYFSLKLWKVFHLLIWNHFCNVNHTLKKQIKVVIWWTGILLVKKHQNGQTTP